MTSVVGYLRAHKSILLYVLFLLFSVAITIMRRPDAVINAQFWAEDGTFWYADAYNKGPLSSLLSPSAGYLQTVSRLTAAISLLVPMAYAPLFMNGVAIAIHVLPVAIVMSGRTSTLFPTVLSRIAFCVLYLFLPNTKEIFLNVTNAQWFLALSALFVVLSRPAVSKLGTVFDGAVLALSGLSGPFALFLLPVAALNWRLNRVRRTYILFAIIVVAAAVQVVAITQTGMGRMQIQSANTPELLLRIVERQVVGGSIIGPYGISWMEAKYAWTQAFLTATAIAGLLFVGYAAIGGSRQVRLVLLFTSMAFASSVLFPVITIRSDVSTWEVMSSSSGVRYWLLPMCGFLIMVSAGLTMSKILRAAATLFILIMIVFSLKTYRDNHGIAYEAYVDLKFVQQVKTFEQLPRGVPLVIPINPPGWTMSLTKK